jgi:hypothetical protein
MHRPKEFSCFAERRREKNDLAIASDKPLILFRGWYGDDRMVWCAEPDERGRLRRWWDRFRHPGGTYPCAVDVFCSSPIKTTTLGYVLPYRDIDLFD